MEPEEKAEVTISRTHVGGKDDDVIVVRIRPDAASEAWEVELSLADFSLIVTGMGGMRGDYRRLKRKPRAIPKT